MTNEKIMLFLEETANMMSGSALTRAAELLSEARLARRRIGFLPEDCRPRTEADGYAVQEALHGVLSRGLGPVAGWKIGCTTANMQRIIGVGGPCGGGVYASTVARGDAALRHADFVRVGVECELAVLLARDLTPDAAPFTRDSVAEAVGACMAAMEIVDDRYEDFHALDPATLIADDFFNAGCVLGQPVEDWREVDIPAVIGTTRVNGEERGSGPASQVMDHPFEALAWLANTRAEQGLGLSAGAFVLTGSMVAPQWLEPGDVVEMTVSGFGRVSARFA
jgi:2-keto-4-pentenoate hydratase